MPARYTNESSCPVHEHQLDSYPAIPEDALALRKTGGGLRGRRDLSCCWNLRKAGWKSLQKLKQERPHSLFFHDCVSIWGFMFPATFPLVLFLLPIPVFSVPFRGSPSARYQHVRPWLNGYLLSVNATLFWKMGAPCRTTTSRRSPLCTWFCPWGVVY